MKICSRCGKEQPVENFRRYYNRGENSGHYRYCKTCESIESRRKYLIRRGDAVTPAQRVELEKIQELYRRRCEAGLDIPGKSSGRTLGQVSILVDTLLQEMNK